MIKVIIFALTLALFINIASCFNETVNTAYMVPPADTPVQCIGSQVSCRNKPCVDGGVVTVMNIGSRGRSLGEESTGCGYTWWKLRVGGNQDCWAPSDSLRAFLRNQSPEDAFNSFVDLFWDANANDLHDTFPNARGNFSHYWIYAHGYQVVVDYHRAHPSQRTSTMIQRLYGTRERKGWRVDFFDDLMWMGITLLDAYYATNKEDGRYLQTAEMLSGWIEAQWDTSCCGPVKGGVWWDTRKTQKATASNLGPVILALRLFRQTGKQKYVDFAQKAFNYWRQNMFDEGTGQVFDHINPDGTKVKWKFTYNEGLMIGACVEFFRHTRDQNYLNLAGKVFDYMLQHQTITSDRFGKVLFDGQNCGGDCRQFKHPTMRYLVELYKETKQERILTFLKSNVDALCRLAATYVPDKGRYIYSVYI